jgi:hypothetical protein
MLAYAAPKRNEAKRIIRKFRKWIISSSAIEIGYRNHGSQGLVVTEIFSTSG